MTTTALSPVRRKVDCPYHSTRMVLLGSWDERHLAVMEAAAAQQRRRGGDQARDDREREGRVQAVLEGPGDELREEARAGDGRLVGRRERVQRVRAEQALDRVVAQERGEQDRDRRQGGRPPGPGRVRGVRACGRSRFWCGL